ncbi:tripartite tricarboxylate transporter TctB family protein [Psychromarinibacter halotolerans]|uniref:Tripartite tricarboxylate transporter TctB family protein n=1 Tax=Psychromarinibacter halotolerans TaxID=1775175 RepID=A0ABV7GSR3_9RHOB|nr:tripartite tricarboxylate transporter TctB family protein [Psychromarinibacter halotolerans]MAQ85477.1 hypothetical protein [Maritimibacter sp.]MDF0595247.1 tripartite tricarboxylate transporter TctB family protein [Psychromarinibacter halotolerans]
MDHRPIAEIGVSCLIIAVCAVFWYEAAQLPPGSFEPLGSGPVPMYTAIVIILCCLFVIARAVGKVRNGGGLAADFRAEFTGGSPAGALIIAGGTLIYAGLLHYKVLPFGLVTFAFLFLTIWTLENLSLKRALPAAIVAAVMSFGTEYLFTKVFIVDLPT